MKNLEIDGVTPPPPLLEAHTWSGKVLSTVANLHVKQDGLQQALIGVVMTQYHVQKGLKVFGEAGADGVRKELQQLHDHKIRYQNWSTQKVYPRNNSLKYWSI